MRDNYTPVLKLKQKTLEMPMSYLHFAAATSPKIQQAPSAMLHADSEAFARLNVDFQGPETPRLLQVRTK